MPSTPAPAPEPPPLLAVHGLKVHFPASNGPARNGPTRNSPTRAPTRAVDGVDFRVAPGQTLGIVGESGSGKTLSCLSLLRLAPPPAQIIAGTAAFEGEDLLQAPPHRLASIRGRRLAMIFQNPATSLDPILSIGHQLTRILRWHTGLSRPDARDRAATLLALVGITDPAARLRQYPHELSGGMKQRIGIARALLCNPALLLADEPTTALDVTIQAQILDLLANLRTRSAMSMILVTHDMGVVARMADRIAVMYAGRVCETADAQTIFNAPQHPYTQALLQSMPRIDRTYPKSPGNPRTLPTIQGRPPDLQNPPTGCRFHPRCPEATPDCAHITPQEQPLTPTHTVSCLHRTPQAPTTNDFPPPLQEGARGGSKPHRPVPRNEGDRPPSSSPHPPPAPPTTRPSPTPTSTPAPPPAPSAGAQRSPGPGRSHDPPH